MAQMKALNPQIAPRRAEQVLSLAAVVVAVLAGVFVVFAVPSFAVSSTVASSTGVTESGEVVVKTLLQEYGIVAPLVALVPIAIAALPLVLPSALPERGRRIVAFASAILLTAAALLSGLTIGMFYAPLVMMLWAVVIAPWRMERGFELANRPVWRIIAGVFVALPGIYIASNASNGTIVLGPLTVAILAATIVLGAALAFGLRLAALIVAAFGLASLIISMIAPSTVLLATWWLGGLYLAIGLAAFLMWGSKRER